MAHWVLDPLGADEQRRCAAGAPGLAPWVPDPQNASGAPVVAHWVQGPLSVDKHRRRAAGAPGLAPGCLIPCARRWLHKTPQGPSGGPLGAGSPGLCAAAGPGLAIWVPHPLCALTISRNSSGALLAHWESDLPAGPPVGSVGLLDGHRSCCAKWRCRGTLDRAGGTMGGVGGGLGAPGWVAVVGVRCGLGGPCPPFPPHRWSAPGGLLLLLRKQPI